MDDRAEPDPAHSNDDSGVRNSDDGGGADLTRSRVSDKAPVQDHDRLLPVANVARIMKNALPENAKISKEAKECVQECVSEFVAFLTSEAADKCSTDRRKTVSGEDIIWAMDSLGFDMYAATMRTFLQRYKDPEGRLASLPQGAVPITPVPLMGTVAIAPPQGGSM